MSGAAAAGAGAAAVSPRKTLYKRTLPDSCIDFTSPVGKSLFRRGLAEGFMETFFPVSSQLRTQEEPAFCGLSSLVVVLNALAVDPGRVWKGSWKWYSETMLDCCISNDRVMAEGITFDQLKCLAECNGLEVEAKRADRSDLDTFRRDVRRVAGDTDGAGAVMLVSYDRKVLSQTGSGHFSPIGGYCAEEDALLIMDVARFKYNPHWVPVSLLWEAQQTVDHATGRSRGTMICTRQRAEAAVTVAKIDMCCVPHLLAQAEAQLAAVRERGADLDPANLTAVIEALVIDAASSDCSGLLLLNGGGRPDGKATEGDGAGVTACMDGCLIVSCSDGVESADGGGEAAKAGEVLGHTAVRLQLRRDKLESLRAEMESMATVLPTVRSALDKAGKGWCLARGLVEIQIALAVMATLPRDATDILLKAAGATSDRIATEVAAVRRQFEAVSRFSRGVADDNGCCNGGGECGT